MFYPMLSSYGSYAAATLARSDATDAKAAAREAKTESDLIRHDINRLLMITEALWTLLKKQCGYNDADLAALITEIDLRDGRLDGKTDTQSMVTCPSCGKTNSNRRPMCIYCGKALPVIPFA